MLKKGRKNGINAKMKISVENVGWTESVDIHHNQFSGWSFGRAGIPKKEVRGSGKKKEKRKTKKGKRNKKGEKEEKGKKRKKGKRKRK